MKDFAIIEADPALKEYRWAFEDLHHRIRSVEESLTKGDCSLVDFASAHHYYGLHFDGSEWIFREWAPNAKYIFLVGEFSGWEKSAEHSLTPIGNGNWEIRKPADFFQHEQLYRLVIEWDGGEGNRLPVYANRVVQDPHTNIFNAQVWHPDTPYKWTIDSFKRSDEQLLIYEAHVGMALEEERVGTYAEFREYILPRIVKAGYNAIQLMAVLEHPYYGSFGYQVSNFFAPSSRFGTPEELKELIDAAHQAGITVLLDLVHSHSVKNEVEGLSRFDGTAHQYFHDRGEHSCHPVWDSRLFNYDSHNVLRFLLSNVRFWLEEFKFDGLRFDGVTSMIYRDHGIGRHFGDYREYFGHNLDRGALAYLGLACKIAHALKPENLLIAEDVSGFPGLAAPAKDGGVGFDYRLGMGVPDYWTKLIKREKDENWNVEEMFHELSNRRTEEKVISYAESHDQALVGDQAFIFRLIGPNMYHHMGCDQRHLMVDRGLSIHKLMRLITVALAGHGYLNFMGNEFGHPEWVDFPREGNNWSYQYARRRWSLRDSPDLYYHKLADFDSSMLELIKEHKVLDEPWPFRLYAHRDDQVLVFRRGTLVFVFNFSPTNSYTDYALELPEGDYSLVFDTDSSSYGGQQRLEAKQIFHSLPGADKSQIKLYLPTRTALVLAPVKGSNAKS